MTDNEEREEREADVAAILEEIDRDGIDQWNVAHRCPMCGALHLNRKFE